VSLSSATAIATGAVRTPAVIADASTFLFKEDLQSSGATRPPWPQ
jgi:hypothetical protein